MPPINVSSPPRLMRSQSSHTAQLEVKIYSNLGSKLLFWDIIHKLSAKALRMLISRQDNAAAIDLSSPFSSSAEFISMMPKWVTLTTEYILHGGSFAIKFCPLMDRDRTAGGGGSAGLSALFSPFCQPYPTVSFMC